MVGGVGDDESYRPEIRRNGRFGYETEGILEEEEGCLEYYDFKSNVVAGSPQQREGTNSVNAGKYYN